MGSYFIVFRNYIVLVSYIVLGRRIYIVLGSYFLKVNIKTLRESTALYVLLIRHIFSELISPCKTLAEELGLYWKTILNGDFFEVLIDPGNIGNKIPLFSWSSIINS